MDQSIERRRRALLYVPGDDPHKIQKASKLGADCICLDLEDGVAINQKHAARESICAALQTMEFGNSEKLVRVNPQRSGLMEVDLHTMLKAHPDGIVLPKVESANQLLKLDRKIRRYEIKQGWEKGRIILIAIAESAKAIINLGEICNSVQRLKAIIFGGEDLAVELNAVRTREAWEIFHARSEVVLHAAAAGIEALDMVFTDFRDNTWLEKEARQGMEMGFSGKQVIHPNQVEIVQNAFTPTKLEIEQAQQIVKAFHENQAAGKGAFAVDGKMIDMPVVKRAQNILLRAGKETS